MTGLLRDGRGAVALALLISATLAFTTSRSPIIAVALTFGALLLWCMFTWADAVLLVLVAILPWEEMLMYPSETVSLVKIVGLLLMVAYLFRALGNREQLYLPWTLAVVLALGLFVGLSLLLSTDPSDGVGKTLRYVLFIIFFFLIVQLVRTKQAVLNVLRAITLSCALASIYALVAFLSGEIARAGGPLREPVDFAYLIVAVLPVSGYLFARERTRRLLWGACFLAIFGAMLASLSRGAVVGLVALAVWAVAARRVPLGGILAAVVGFATVVGVAFAFWGPLIHERLDEKGRAAAGNVDSRQAFWKAAVDVAADHPLAGVGPARFGPENGGYIAGDPSGIKDPVAHNSYLEILAENGIFALALFLLYLAGSWLMLSRAYVRSRDEGDVDGARLATALQASLLVALTSGFFLSEQLAVPFWLFGALAAVVGGWYAAEPARARAAGQPSPAPAPAPA